MFSVYQYWLKYEQVTVCMLSLVVLKSSGLEAKEKTRTVLALGHCFFSELFIIQQLLTLKRKQDYVEILKQNLQDFIEYMFVVIQILNHIVLNYSERKGS